MRGKTRISDTYPSGFPKDIPRIILGIALVLVGWVSRSVGKTSTVKTIKE